jgi:hypothetical protein
VTKRPIQARSALGGGIFGQEYRGGAYCGEFASVRGFDQRLPGWEMPVDDAHADARVPGDGLDRRVLAAFVGEGTCRSGERPFPVAPGVRARGALGVGVARWHVALLTPLNVS